MKRPDFEHMSTEQLSGWWQQEVGYDPLDPETGGWTAEALPQLCAEMFDEMQAAEEEVRHES